MMKILIPALLALIGLVGGAFVGVVLKKPADAEYGETGELKDGEKPAGDDDEDADADAYDGEQSADSEYFELSRKLIVPVVDQRGDRSFVRA